MAEIVKDFIHSRVPARDAQDIEDNFLRKSIVMSKRKPAAKKPHVRLRKGTLTSTSRRQLGFHKLARTGHRYSDYLPMNELWQQYVAEYLQLGRLREQGFRAEPEDTRTEHVLLQLCRADFHGAQLRVLRAHCHSLQGAAGIVLLESRGTFQIVTPQNKVKIIPKQHTIFETSIEGFTIRLFGNNFMARPTARGMKKIKAKKTIEL